MELQHEPKFYSRSEHNISRRDIDPDALKVLYRLARHHHTAYLVGGGVRDLLLGRHPKDFDVSTSAHPNQIKRLFRNCFLIGRRFRLAHVKYGDKVIETSTFRAMPKQLGNPDDPDSDLFQRDDNQFGTPEEDAWRRDFTINGLFYDIENFSVIDYVGGMADLKEGVVRCIGDPDIRFREDPVRMVRAVRFAARLGFKIESATLKSIQHHHQEIEKASAPRMLEEIYRLFGFSSGHDAIRLLRETLLLESIFPALDAYLDSHGEEDNPLWGYLKALDAGDTIVGESTPPLILSSLYYPLIAEALPPFPAVEDKMQPAKSFRDCFSDALDRLCIPKRVMDRLSRILVAQQRMTAGKRRRFSRSRFVSQESFPEALALYEIHLQATGGDLSSLQEWRDLYEEYRERLDGIAVTSDEGQEKRDTRLTKRRRRRRPRRKTAAKEAVQTEESDGKEQPATETSAKDETEDKPKPAKRSRRRRSRKKTPAKEESLAEESGNKDQAPAENAAGENGDDQTEEEKKPRRRRRSRGSRGGRKHDESKDTPKEEKTSVDLDKPISGASLYVKSGEDSAPDWMEEI